jgi:hypothetical protein
MPILLQVSTDQNQIWRIGKTRVDLADEPFPFWDLVCRRDTYGSAAVHQFDVFFVQAVFRTKGPDTFVLGFA